MPKISKQPLRLRTVDYATGIAILGIVYLHGAGSLVLAGLRPQTPLNLALHGMFDKASVAIFFLASGLFVAQSLDKLGTTQFIWSKVRTLLYPYLVWSLLKGGLQIALSGQTNTTRGFGDLVAIWYEPLGHLWFFYALFLAQVLFAIFGRMPHSKNLLFIGALAIFFLPKLPLTLYAKLAENFIFFVAGVGLSTKIQAGWRPNIPPVILAVATTATGWFGVTILPGNLRVPIIVFVFAVASTIVVYGVAHKLEQLNWLPFLAYFGKHSLGIYVAHTIVQATIRIVTSRLLGVTNPTFLFALLLVFGTLIPLALYVGSQAINFPYLYQWPSRHRQQSLVRAGQLKGTL